MSELLGNVQIPSITPSGSFPLKTSYPYSHEIEPPVVVHRFGALDGKLEQRFYLGSGARRFTVRRESLSIASRNQLRNFWETNFGTEGSFTYAAPNPDGSTSSVTCRFADPTLTLEMLVSGICSTGVTLVEVPTNGPSYTSSQTVTRAPNSTLKTALSAQVQTVFPLIKIVPRASGYPAIYISDRRVTVDGHLYQPRLLDFDGISQQLRDGSDQARFSLGNADDVIRALFYDVDLWHASIEFSLFHVASLTTIQLWKGHIIDWDYSAGGVFPITASDGLYELTLMYPGRKIARECYKPFNDGTLCPYSTQGSGGSSSSCDRGYATANGCQAHHMDKYFGGILATPQLVRTKDNSTGTLGFGRDVLTSSSIIADSLYGKVLKEVYTDITMPVNADIASFRDEGDFAIALAVVGAGPIDSYDPDNKLHLLDGQPNHGPGTLGLLLSKGADPNPDPFSLGEGANGIQRYGSEHAAGTAFVQIRRTDTAGLQLTTLDEHRCQVQVLRGMSGWIWTGANSRSWGVLTNPVWVAVNAHLRGLGLQKASAAVCERYFVVDAAVTAAGYCDTMVNRLIGTGTEKQFHFKGVIQDRKPLRDWLAEILFTGLCYFTFEFGKLRIGCRINASAVSAFTAGSMLWESLRLKPKRPTFNSIEVNFADSEFGWVNNNVRFTDFDHTAYLGTDGNPVVMSKQMNLAGTSDKSVAARIATIVQREELGGISATEWAKALDLSWSTTVLGLEVGPGDVVSITDDAMPSGIGKARITKWKLNRDYSIDLEATTVTDSMYDLLVGPKPADVPAPELPVLPEFSPADWGFSADTPEDGTLRLKEFFCATNAMSVTKGYFDVYHVPETEIGYARLVGNMTSTSTTVGYEGQAPTPGTWILIEGELMLVTTCTPNDDQGGSCTVLRGVEGTTKHAHIRTEFAITALGDGCELTVTTGLSIAPGARIFLLSNSEQATIASYDAATGKLFTTSPLVGAATGAVYSDPRIYRVNKYTENVAFQPRFFRSASRAGYTYPIALPMAGVVSIRGVLENTRGLQSDPVYRTFTDTYPYRLRTYGQTGLVMVDPEVPDGETENNFLPVHVASPSSFRRAYAERTTPDDEGGPIVAPRSISAIQFADPQPSGEIQLGGSVLSGGQAQVTIGDPTADRGYVFVPPYTVTDEDSLPAAAAGLAIWLNDHEEFAAYFSAKTNGAQSVLILDKAGVGGILSVDVAGGLTATVTGLASPLNIQTGRRYAVAFGSSVLGLRSALSPLSPSTGPSGDAQRVEIKDFPRSTDSRVNRVYLYATPDGAEGPLHYVGQKFNNTDQISDGLSETQLAATQAWPGEAQPSASGVVHVTVYRDGERWCDFYIAETASRSNVIDGLALDHTAEDTEITADVDNDAGQHNLRVVFE